MSSGWSWYIIILTLGNIAGSWWLLRHYSKKRVVTKDQDDNTTGHVWDDDLTELNNPLPRWWLWLFILTILFSLVYLVLYPGLGNYKGWLNWSQDKAYLQETQQIEARYAQIYDQFLQQDIPTLAQDPQALKTGQRLFINNCSTCHGSDAKGARSFPNLTDSEWLYGGTPQAIKHSITYGRSGIMTPWAAVLQDNGVKEVVAYVQQMSGQAYDADLAKSGQQHYQTFCVACHGPEGKGNIMLGAPDLSNDIWLYGGDTESLTETISKGRNGKMPAQQNLLNEGKIHVLSAYIYSLSQSAND